MDKVCETCRNYAFGAGCTSGIKDWGRWRSCDESACSGWEKREGFSEVCLTEWPGEREWMEVKRRALVTVGKSPVNEPAEGWKRAILTARHSPVRYLRFSFDIRAKTWVATHLARHVHAQPYIQSQRDDLTGTDRDNLPQSAPVRMIYDVNAEELITIAGKRLCRKAHLETRVTVEEMCQQVVEKCPEFAEVLFPMCAQMGGRCPEMKSCGQGALMEWKYRKLYERALKETDQKEK